MVCHRASDHDRENRDRANDHDRVSRDRASDHGPRMAHRRANDRVVVVANAC